jgi:hypothetical protein
MIWVDPALSMSSETAARELKIVLPLEAAVVNRDLLHTDIL